MEINSEPLTEMKAQLSNDVSIIKQAYYNTYLLNRIQGMIKRSFLYPVFNYCSV